MHCHALSDAARLIHVLEPVIPQVRPRSPSPAEVRKRTLAFPFIHRSRLPRSFTVEAICAIPHPVPTHALASSFCMSHLLTGSDDGYIRDYDIFAAVNGKVTLTAPQRHHCNVVEGNMKSGQIRCWWENPDLVNLQNGYPQGSETTVSPVYSMAMHSDALWALGGTNVRPLYSRHHSESIFSPDHSAVTLIYSRFDTNLVCWRM